MSLGKLFGDIGKSVEKAAKDVEKDIDKSIHTIPQNALQNGNIVKLRSKSNNKFLRILENGTIDCSGDGGSSCEYLVIASMEHPGSLKFRNMANTLWYLGLVQGGPTMPNQPPPIYLAASGGGPECDFLPSMQLDNFVALQSSQFPGSHIGALPSGQVTSPTMTPATSDAAFFKVVFLRKQF